MSKLINKTPKPRTRESIRKDLIDLGVEKGMTVLVHSSLSSIGWVAGGAVAVIQALMDAVTEEGTIVMPSQSDDFSDPSGWENPPVPEEWWDEIRDNMPAYHPDYTPAERMGKIVEVFRTFPGVKRSSHPLLSFAAWGKDRDDILADHSLQFGLGEGSPLRKLYDRTSHVLLLGADFDSCTCLHLAEYRIPKQDVITKGSPIIENGERVWKEHEDIEFRDELFQQIGDDFEKEDDVKQGFAGSAKSRLFSLKAAVDYAEKWLSNYDLK